MTLKLKKKEKKRKRGDHWVHVFEIKIWVIGYNVFEIKRRSMSIDYFK